MVAHLYSRQPTSALAGGDAPPWAQRWALRITRTYLAVFPQAPVRIWQANKADLPPANEWAGALVSVPDQDCVAISDGASWRKITLGGPV